MPVFKTHLDATERGVAFLCNPLTDAERRDLNLFIENEGYESAVAIDGEDKVVYRLPHGTDEVAHETIAKLEAYLNGLRWSRFSGQDAKLIPT